MKDKAIEKLDKLKGKISKEDVEVTSINEKSTSNNGGSIQINYEGKNDNSSQIGFEANKYE